MGIGYLFRAFGVATAQAPAVSVARLAGCAGLAYFSVVLIRRAWRHRADNRAVVGCCAAALAALTLLAPTFYPWYAATPIAVLATCANAVGIRRLAVIGAGLALLILPNGLGLAIITKLPGSMIVTTFVTWAGWRRLRRGPGRHPSQAKLAVGGGAARQLRRSSRSSVGVRDAGTGPRRRQGDAGAFHALPDDAVE
jgi:hypothetical protein